MRLRRRAGRVGAGVLVGCAVLAACAATPERTAPRIIDLGRDAGADVAVVDPARADVLPAPALRLAVEHLLAVHGVTATTSMRTLAAGHDASEEIDALAANTRDLTAAIGLVYGPIGARAFDQLWAQHTQAFLDYAAARDRAARTAALAHLRDYERDFGTFIQTATGGAVPAAAVQTMLEQHVAQMIGQLDRLRQGDDVGATELVGESIDYLSTIGFALTGGFAAQSPRAFPGAIDSPLVAFCSLTARDDARRATLTAVAGDDDVPVRSAGAVVAIDDAYERAQARLAEG